MNEPSLKGLHMPLTKEFIEERMKAFAEEKARYKAKYGDDWRSQWLEDHSVPKDYDSDMKSINTAIYYNDAVAITSNDPDRIRAFNRKREDRNREVYGDQYDELYRHKPEDPRVAELLLQDALETGKWKELPDVLQDEYKRRTGDVNE